jgi:hypothetical protein
MYLKIKQLKNTIIMRKNYYEEPQAELIVVRFEENIMSPTYNGDNNQIPDDGGEENF